MRTQLSYARQIGDRASSLPTGVLPVVLGFGVPWILLTVYMLVSGGDTREAIFLVGTGWFVMLGLGFLGVYGLRRVLWCSVPALITVRALLEFGIIPTWRVLRGDDNVDALYVKAILLVLLGFLAFWIGSLVIQRKMSLQFQPQSPTTTGRVYFASLLMLVLGVIFKLVLWKSGLNSYMADEGARASAAPIIQWLALGGNALSAALIISSIEVFGKKKPLFSMRFIFWCSLGFSLFFGLISGMKEEILRPLVCLLVVYGIVRARVPRLVVILPIILVLIYPFVSAYRDNLNRGYRSQANTLSGLGSVLQKSVTDVTGSAGHSKSGHLEHGFESTTQRLSLLGLVRDVIGLPSPSLLNGDEKIWMAPFYPLVPRFFWKDKPVLNKGQRFSVALGLSRLSSTAITPIGDLFVLDGWIGIVVGMFIYGFATQILMNVLGKGFSEKGVFFYFLILLPLINLEMDVFSLVSSAISSLLTAFVFAQLVYGGRLMQFGPLRAPSGAANEVPQVSPLSVRNLRDFGDLYEPR
jgi:hypothetical protein